MYFAREHAVSNFDNIFMDGILSQLVTNFLRLFTSILKLFYIV